MKKQPKLLIGIIAAVIVLAVVVISIVMSVAGGSKDTYDSHMELAQRYLDELQYEQAIAEYEAAIAIEPNNPEAYLGLAEVYVAMGDMEKALDVLAEDYEHTQSERIAKRRAELTQALSEANSTGEKQTLPDTFVPWSEAGFEDHVMDWKDENLEAAMRDITGIYDRDIMLSDVWELTELYLSFDPISDISALGGLINLTWLDLVSDPISDISALGGLINLTWLDLVSDPISDISALSGLTNLTELDLSSNPISDISALRDMSNLERLRLVSDQISDIGALSGMTNLTDLILASNQISDISALGGLTDLTELDLYDNPIKDYSPVGFVERNGGTLNK